MPTATSAKEPGSGTDPGAVTALMLSNTNPAVEEKLTDVKWVGKMSYRYRLIGEDLQIT